MSVTCKKIFEYNGNIVSIDLSNIKFCPGPCKYTMEESETSVDMSQNFNGNINSFKPYSGGKYTRFCYPINDKQILILNNLRICSSCHHRYLEFTEENYIDDLKIDANTIMKKLEKNIK
jgi:hypothetical protein